MKRVLVTGGTGFIGRQSIEPLVRLGYEVHAAVRRPPAQGPATGVMWHEADLLDPQVAMSLMKAVRPSHLLHLAWYAEHGKFWAAPVNVEWVEATLRLVRTFAAAGGTRAVLAGTCAEYDVATGFCSEAVTPLRPHSLYGAGKLAVERVIAAASEGLAVSYAWGRVFFLYGPHEHPNRLVSSVIRSLLQGEPAMCSHGRQLRDFLHVADVASAFVHLLDSEVEGPVNIGSGVPHFIGTVSEHLGAMTGRSDLLRMGAVGVAPDEPPLILADVRRLTNEVGWRPHWTLDTGLRATLEWWQEELLATGGRGGPRP